MIGIFGACASWCLWTGADLRKPAQARAGISGRRTPLRQFAPLLWVFSLKKRKPIRAWCCALAQAQRRPSGALRRLAHELRKGKREDQC